MNERTQTVIPSKYLVTLFRVCEALAFLFSLCDAEVCTCCESDNSKRELVKCTNTLCWLLVSQCSIRL